MAIAAYRNRDDISLCSLSSPCRCYRPEQQNDPSSQSCSQHYLPGASQVQVLPPLVPEPKPESAKKLVNAEHLPHKASGNDHNQRAKQQINTAYLPFGILPAQGGGEEQATGDIGGRDPEDRQL